MNSILTLRKKITNVFKLHGINLLGDECNYLTEQLAPLNEIETEELLNNIVDNLRMQRLEGSRVDRATLESVINKLHTENPYERQGLLTVLNAFQLPRTILDEHTKNLNRGRQKRSIIADVNMKAAHLRQRYLMLLQKTQRHELFAPKIIENGVSEQSRAKKFKLFFVENLLSTSHVSDAVILGYLSQMKTGQYYLIDLTGSVQLNLANVRFHSGFFCEGSFVLAEGNYSDKVLNVSGLGFPPAESAKSSLTFLGQHGSAADCSDILIKNSKHLADIERNNHEASIVFVSDVHLDQPDVRKKLRQLFLGYDDYPPIAIVLMGPFSSTCSDLYKLRSLLRELGDLADGCVHLKLDTDLVLVPANDDPAAPNILPRPPLPKALAVDLLKMWPRVKLASNPCKLQYCTQQITVCRLDLMAKFCRNTLHFPADSEQIEHHLARTIICQGHLAPLNPLVVPVHWDFDNALWLFPLPELVVVGDSCRAYQTVQHGCSVINPGSFSQSKYVFKAYFPATSTVQDSQIPEDVDTEEN